MAAILRNGNHANPVIHSAIVDVDGGLAGGEFVEYDATDNTVVKKASGFDENTYITLEVEHDPNCIGDDATAVVPKGGYIKIVRLNEGEEITITGLTTTVGSVIRDHFLVTGTGKLHGLAAHHLRCIVSTAAATE